MNLRYWLRQHSLKLLAIRDTPQAIAEGVAIGIFFGFMPLFGIKTLSSIFCAWLTGSNILAAVIACALHDLLLPVMPAVYMWQYDLGYWLLSTPHHWPAPLYRLRLEGAPWHWWTTLFSVGEPLLVGGLVFSTPAALAAFFVTKRLVARHQLKKGTHHVQGDEPQSAS